MKIILLLIIQKIPQKLMKIIILLTKMIKISLMKIIIIIIKKFIQQMKNI